MKKDFRASVVEFATTLSDEEVRFVATRLNDRYAGDMAEALNYLCGKPQMDVILNSAANAEEFFDYCDGIRDVAFREIKRRAATLVAGGEFKPSFGERPPRTYSRNDGAPRPPFDPNRQQGGGGYNNNNGGGGGDRPYKTYQKRT